MKPTTFDQSTDGRVSAASSSAAPSPAASFGEQLRRAREARGIPLREIADQTRISIRYLEGIEANDYKQLPGGIFNRSFIKAYARYIGFNEKEALEAYTHTAREQGELPNESGPILQTSRVYLNEQHGRSPLLTAFLTILVLAILSLGVYAALRRYQKRVGKEEAVLQQNNQPSAGAAVPAPAPTVMVAQSAPASSFKVEVTALGEDVWMRVRSDQESAADVTVKADTSREFSPAERLTLQYSKSRAKSIQVKVNGQPATVPVEGKGSLAEMVINRGDGASVSQ